MKKKERSIWGPGFEGCKYPPLEMASEDFSQGICDELWDPGPIHILEYGRLRSTPGYEQRSPKWKKQCVIDLSWQKDLAPKKNLATMKDLALEKRDDVNGVTESDDTKETKNVVSIPSLKTLCVHFVAHHIQLVESLIDFPDIIGKEIFDVLCEIGLLKRKASKCESTITLFSEAYQNELLSAMCLRKGYLLIEKMPNIVPLFPYLEELDLGWCKLKDDSEILQHIGQLLCLSKLSLQGNMLTSRGIQKLTAPYRMFETGLCQLAHLDISCNRRISRDVEKYLKWFNLESLNLSGTLISVKSIKDLEISLDMTHVNFEEFHHYDIINKGWAASVVRQWMDACLTEVEDKPVMKSGLTNFYAKKKTPDVDDTIVPSTETVHPRIHLMNLNMHRNVQREGLYKSKEISLSNTQVSLNNTQVSLSNKGLSLDDIVETVTKDQTQGEDEVDSDQENTTPILKPRCNILNKLGSRQTELSGSHMAPFNPTLRELHLERQSMHQIKNPQKSKTKTKQVKVMAAGFDMEDWDVLSGYL